MYDSSILNPVNFQIIVMCQQARLYFKNSKSINNMLIKMYAKLGLGSLVTSYSKELLNGFKKDDTMIIDQNDDENRERLNAQRFSVYTDFGLYADLGDLINEQQNKYLEKTDLNRQQMVDYFQARDFEPISEILESNAKLESSGFMHALKLAKTL